MNRTWRQCVCPGNCGFGGIPAHPYWGSRQLLPVAVTAQACCRGSSVATVARHCNALDTFNAVAEEEGNWPDPQLDHGQHLRRAWRQSLRADRPPPAGTADNGSHAARQQPCAAYPIRPCPQGEPSAAVAPSTPPRLLSPRRRSPQRRQLRPVAEAMHGTGSGPDGLPSAWQPEPGTVADQSSCALLLLPLTRHRRPRRRSGEDGVGNGSRPNGSALGEAVAARAAVAVRGAGLVSGPRRAVLVPLWRQQPWLPPLAPQAWVAREPHTPRIEERERAPLRDSTEQHEDVDGASIRPERAVPAVVDWAGSCRSSSITGYYEANDEEQGSGGHTLGLGPGQRQRQRRVVLERATQRAQTLALRTLLLRRRRRWRQGTTGDTEVAPGRGNLGTGAGACSSADACGKPRVGSRVEVDDVGGAPLTHGAAPGPAVSPASSASSSASDQRPAAGDAAAACVPVSAPADARMHEALADASPQLGPESNSFPQGTAETRTYGHTARSTTQELGPGAGSSGAGGQPGHSSTMVVEGVAPRVLRPRGHLRRAGPAESTGRFADGPAPVLLPSPTEAAAAAAVAWSAPAQGAESRRDASGDESMRHVDGDAAARQLTRGIGRCRHWRQLMAIVRASGCRLNAVHVTAVLTALARMPLPPPSRLPSHPQQDNISERQRYDADALSASRAAADVADLQALIGDLEAAFGEHLAAAWSQLSGGEAPAAVSGRNSDACNSSNGSGSSCREEDGTSGAAGSAHAYAASRPGLNLGSAAGSLGAALGPRQLATCMAAMARLRAAGWQVVEDARRNQLAVAVAALWGFKAFSPQELVTMLSVVAKLGLRPHTAWMQAAVAAAGAAASAGCMSPRQLSTTLWALATLRYQPGRRFTSAWLTASYRTMPYFSAYDISQSLWALATLRMATSTAGAGAGAAPPSAAMAATAPSAAAARFPEAWVGAALSRAAVTLRPGGCAPQDVCNAMWGVARLGLTPPQRWVETVTAPLLASLPAAAAALERCKPVDLAGLLWALAALRPRCGRPTPETMLRLCGVVARAAPRFGEQDLANAMWALGRLRFVPPSEMLRPLGARLAEMAAEGGVGPQLVSTALWCCVRLQLPPGRRLLDALLLAAAARAGKFGPQSAALLLYCLARMQYLGWLPQADWQAALTAPPPSAEAAEDNAAEAADAAAEPQRRGTPPPPAPLPLRPILDAALRGLAGDGAEEEAEAMGGQCGQRITLPVLLWSLARLGCAPDEGWMRGVLVHSVEVLPSLTPAEAGLMATSLAALRYAPPPLWLDRLDQLRERRWEPMAAAEARALAEAAAAAAEAEQAVALAQAAAADAETEAELEQTVMQGESMRLECEERRAELQEAREELERRQRELAWRRTRLGHLQTSLGRLRLGLRRLGKQPACATQ